jgi:hypothetical protein
MENRLVKTIIGIPTDIFDPLVKFSFDKRYNEVVYTGFIIPNLFPLYYHFKNITDLGNIIMAKTMGREKDIPMLFSEKSLEPFKAHLKTSKKTRLMELGIDNRIFNLMRSVSYSGSDIMKFQMEGALDGGVLGAILDNSLAYFYWCISKVCEGRRIGYIKDHDGVPDMRDKFHEMNMQMFIPGYNEMKGHFNF